MGRAGFQLFQGLQAIREWQGDLKIVEYDISESRRIIQNHDGG